MTESSICIIPARGGSKRIPRKNIKEFLNKPLIEWPIKAALQSNCFEHVIVSTDDKEIAGISRKCGAIVPFEREKELADDYTGTIDVIKNEIEKLMKIGIKSKYVCCMYPTAPFVTPSLLKLAAKKISTNGNRYLLTGTKYDYPIQRALRKNGNDCYEMNENKYLTERSQDLEEMFHDAGQFYWAKRNVWMSKSNIFDDANLILLPSWRVQDIDTSDDWISAEIKLKSIIQRGMHE